MSTFVDEEQNKERNKTLGIILFFVREGGHWASAPHTKYRSDLCQ